MVNTFLRPWETGEISVIFVDFCQLILYNWGNWQGIQPMKNLGPFVLTMEIL